MLVASVAVVVQYIASRNKKNSGNKKSKPHISEREVLQKRKSLEGEIESVRVRERERRRLGEKIERECDCSDREKETDQGQASCVINY